jgi:hypothetical protein
MLSRRGVTSGNQVSVLTQEDQLLSVVWSAPLAAQVSKQTITAITDRVMEGDGRRGRIGPLDRPRRRSLDRTSLYPEPLLHSLVAGLNPESYTTRIKLLCYKFRKVPQDDYDRRYFLINTIEHLGDEIPPYRKRVPVLCPTRDAC